MSEASGQGGARAERRSVEALYEPDPAQPGWHRWGPRENGHFNDLYGPMWVRPEAEGAAGARRATVRIVPPAELLTSANGTVHGGALLGFLDVALFAGLRGCGIENSGDAVTLDISVQFLAAGRPGQAIDAALEILRETGRLFFLRGDVLQSGERIAAFTAIVRKPAGR